jgi:hypothetical protein
MHSGIKRFLRRFFWRWMEPDIPEKYRSHWEVYGELPTYARYEGLDDE